MELEHDFENTGAIEMPPDDRDYELGGAAEYPAVLMNQKALNLPILYQRQIPA